MTKFVIIIKTTEQLKDITAKLFDAGHMFMNISGNQIDAVAHISFDYEDFEESLAIKEIVVENNLETFKF